METSQSDPQTMADTGFFRLPLELREEIYLSYLHVSNRPTPWMLYRHTRTDPSPQKSPLGSVSKQFREEMLEVLRRQRNFCYRISPKEATFDRLTLAHCRVLGKELPYTGNPHLKIEIYPPHPDRPIDIVHIWRRVHTLCNRISTTLVIENLSIHFM